MNKQQLEELLNQALSSNNLVDKQLFHQFLYEATYDLVAAKVKRYFPFMVDDICQEIYLYKVLKLKLQKVKEKLPFFEGFLTILVKNYCLRRKERERVFLPYNADIISEHLNPIYSTPVLEKDTGQCYLKLLDAHLPPRQAKIIHLRVFEEYPFDVIRYRMGLASTGAARQLFFQAKRKLQKVL